MVVLFCFFLAVVCFLLAIFLLIRPFLKAFSDGWPSRVDLSTGWSVETLPFFFGGLAVGTFVKNGVCKAVFRPRHPPLPPPPAGGGG